MTTLRFKHAIILMSCCLTPLMLRAEEKPVQLDWPKAVALTEQYNFDLKLAQEKLNEAIYQKNSVASAQNIKISTGLNADTTYSKNTNPPANHDSQSLGLNANYLLFDGFKTKFNILSAESDITILEFNLAVTESNVRLDLRTKFCNLLRAQAMFKLTESIESKRKQQFELLRLRYKAGLEHKGAFLTAEANLASAASELIKAQRALVIEQKNLAQVIGITPGKTVTATENLTPKTDVVTDPDFEYLLQETPLLNTLVYKKIQAKYNLEAAKSSYWPQIYTSAGANKSFQSQNRIYDSWSAGLSVSYAIFDGGQRSQNIKKAQSQLKQREWEYRQSAQEILTTMAQAFNEFKNAIDDAQVSARFLTAAQERATIAEAQYTSGLISFDNWTIIEDDLINVQKRFLTSQITALIAEAKWIQAKGGTLDDI